jgi:rhodanese-related sulfurtransferase
MQTTSTRVQDPSKCRTYFENKLSFTTGPVELDRMIKSNNNNIVVVDVRASEDYAKGHIPGAINLPQEHWSNPIGLHRDRTNVLYCYTQNCHLAASAAVQFASQGYPVMELDGGFATWKKSDMDIEHEPVNRLKRVGERILHRRHTSL